MERIKGLLEKAKNHKQQLIIFSGMFILVITIVFLFIFVTNENKQRKAFVLQVQNLYDTIQEKYNLEASKNNVIHYFSNTIYGTRFENIGLRYCAIVDDNGEVTSLEATNGKYYVKTTDGETTGKIKRIGYEKFKCSHELPRLAVSGYDAVNHSRNTIFGGNLEEFKIESIKFMPNKNIPEKAIGSFDVSDKKDGSIMAWYLDKNKNNMYELYIGGDGGVHANEDSSYMFAGIYNLKSIDLTYLDTNGVTNMKGMFYYLSNLESLNVDNINTADVTDMSEMFYYLLAVKDLDLRSFDTSNVKDMSYMFVGNWSIESLNLSSFDTSKVTNMKGMFTDCSKLENVDVTNFDTSNVKDMSEMFKGCYMFTDDNLKAFKIPKSTKVDYMFCGTQLKNDSPLISNYNGKNKEKMLTCP